MTTTPLTVLDLVPISSGSNPAQALRNSIDLAQQTERLGYARYWFAEHHLNPGVAGTSPAVVLALTAAATSTIRLGSGAVQMGIAPPCPRSRSSACWTPCTGAASTSAWAARAAGRANPGRPRWPAAAPRPP
jgi:Luciferase-like monooxygenase